MWKITFHSTKICSIHLFEYFIVLHPLFNYSKACLKSIKQYFKKLRLKSWFSKLLQFLGIGFMVIMLKAFDRSYPYNSISLLIWNILWNKISAWYLEYNQSYDILCKMATTPYIWKSGFIVLKFIVYMYMNVPVSIEIK